MKRKILCLLIFGSCAFCLCVPCLAYTTASSFNPCEAYLNPVPYSVDFYRSDNTSHYYYGDDNILSGDFTVFDDSNLDYKYNRYDDINQTPFLFTSYDVGTVYSLAEYRYNSSAQINYEVKIEAVPGKYNQILDLRTVPDLFAYTSNTATFQLVCELIAESGRTISINRTVNVGSSGTSAYFSSWNVILEYLTSIGYDNFLEQSVYLSRLYIRTVGSYNGCGTYRWLGLTDTLVTFPTVSLGGSFELADRITIGEALDSLGVVFRGIHNVLSVEILPFLTLYRLLGIAVLIPATIKIVRSV